MLYKYCFLQNSNLRQSVLSPTLARIIRIVNIPTHVNWTWQRTSFISHRKMYDSISWCLTIKDITFNLTPIKHNLIELFILTWKFQALVHLMVWWEDIVEIVLSRLKKKVITVLHSNYFCQRNHFISKVNKGSRIYLKALHFTDISRI